MIRRVLQGFLLGILCFCAAVLAGLLVVRPVIAAAQARALKTEYLVISPGANGSGALPAGEATDTLVNLWALQQEYPDIQGWLTIPGTAVDYPVLQSSNQEPEKYLRRNYDGEWRMAGSLFFQYDCTPKSRNMVIYGHNMTDGTMFAVLGHYKDPVFLKEHSEMVLQTADGVHHYTVVAAMTTDTAQLRFNRAQFADDTDFVSFAGSMLAETDITPQPEDRLLTLVTCAYDWAEARTVIVAVEQSQTNNRQSVQPLCLDE